MTYCRISLRIITEDNNYEVCIANLYRTNSNQRKFMLYGNYYFPPDTLGELFKQSINNGFHSEKYKREVTDGNYLPGKIIFSTADRICLEEQNRKYGSRWRKTIYIDSPYIRTKVEAKINREWTNKQIPLCLPPEDFQILIKEAKKKEWF